MNGTLKNPKKNSNQKKSKKRIADGGENIEGNLEPEGGEPESLKLTEKTPLKKQLPEQNGQCVTIYMEDPMEEPDDEDENNKEETRIGLKEGEFQNCLVGIEKTEKYEEVHTTNTTNEITHNKAENIPSFQNQISSASKKINKQASKDNVLPSNSNSVTINDSKEIIEKSSCVNTANVIDDDHNYMSAPTLRVGRVKEQDTIELRRMECSTDAFYNRNTDVYSKNYSSSENMQETDELFNDQTIDNIIDSFKNIGKDLSDEPNKENGQVMIHESEYGFKYEEKHFVSKLEKQRQRIDSLQYKPLSLESIPTEHGPPVITIQPPLQIKPPLQRTVFKPLPITQGKITDEIDGKICFNGEKKQNDKDEYPDIYNVKYRSNCVLDCFCCVLESLI